MGLLSNNQFLNLAKPGSSKDKKGKGKSLGGVACGAVAKKLATKSRLLSSFRISTVPTLIFMIQPPKKIVVSANTLPPNRKP
jgi:hypothetical protein